MHVASASNKKNTKVIQLLLNHSSTRLDTVINKMGCNNSKINGRTPLNYVYDYNQSKIKKHIITCLRKFGAKKKKQLLVDTLLDEKYKKDDLKKGTPFVVACEKGFIDDINCFIENHLDTDNNNLTSLAYYINQPGHNSEGTIVKPGIYLAAYNNQFDVVEHLLKFGAKITDVGEAAMTHVVEQYKHGFPNGTPFIVACEKNNLDDVKFFVEYYKNDHNGNVTLKTFINQLGKDSDADDGEEMITGLIMSSEYEHLAIVAYLLENNASIDRVDDYGNTALHFAAQFNEKNTDVVELLLKHPSMTIDIINKQNKGGYTALDYAYANETKIKFDMIKIISNHNGKRALELEKEKKKLDVEEDFMMRSNEELLNELHALKTLTVKEFDIVKKRDAKEKSPFIKTNNELQLELKESRELGAFIYAAKEEDIKTMQELLYKGAKLSQTTRNLKRWNALHYAAACNKRNVNTVKFLLNHPDILDFEVINKQAEDDGMTPLDVAISFNKSIINHDIIRTLKKKGCKTSKELQSLPES